MPRLHVAWFEDPQRYPVRWDLVLSGRTLIAVVVAALAALLLVGLRRLVQDNDWPRAAFLGRMAVGAPTLLAVQAAIALIYSGVAPVVLAPQLHAGNHPVAYLLGAAEVAIGFSFITGIADRAAAALLAGIVALSFSLFPALDAAAQLHWAGIALVIYVIGRQAARADRPRPAQSMRLPLSPGAAISGLRVLTGLAIVTPALAEKIWNPDIAGAFLSRHPDFNLPQHLLGLGWATDERFIMAAGVVELTIGVLLVSGLMTRVVIVAMWFPFNLSVPFLPPQELIWHIPFFGIMYFLLVHPSRPDPEPAQIT